MAVIQSDSDVSRQILSETGINRASGLFHHSMEDLAVRFLPSTLGIHRFMISAATEQMTRLKAIAPSMHNS